VVWWIRCQEGLSPTGLADERDFPTLDSLVQRRREEEAEMQNYLKSLPEDVSTKRVSYTTTESVPYENVLWY